MMANRQIAESYRRLAYSPPPVLQDFRAIYDVIEAQDSGQRNGDSRNKSFSQKSRLGMRAALFERQKLCAGFSIAPTIYIQQQVEYVVTSPNEGPVVELGPF